MRWERPSISDACSWDLPVEADPRRASVPISASERRSLSNGGQEGRQRREHLVGSLFGDPVAHAGVTRL